MQKVIENAVIKITQAMEKNRNAYVVAQENFNDTGYDRYQKKMDRLDEEYEELRTFIHPKEKDEVSEEVTEKVYQERDEMRQALLNLKSKWQNLKADLPVSVDTIGIDDIFRDIRISVK